MSRCLCFQELKCILQFNHPTIKLPGKLKKCSSSLDISITAKTCLFGQLRECSIVARDHIRCVEGGPKTEFGRVKRCLLDNMRKSSEVSCFQCACRQSMSSKGSLELLYCCSRGERLRHYRGLDASAAKVVTCAFIVL